ncbi:MAG: sugar ABC transporter permease [Clostridiales bacterium]|nr:sugar ABC transporter permease [Clostridiales bacterium]
MSDMAIKKRQKPPKQKSQAPMFLLYCLPALIFFGVFKYWPMIYSAVLSFAKWNFVKDIKWIGWTNYATMFDKAMFLKGIGNTFLYIVALLPFFIVLPLILATALLAVRHKKLQGIFKAIYFIPTVLAFSIICYVWIWIYNPTYGLLNKFIGLFGIPSYSWLSDPKVAFFAIVLVCGWKYMGQNMILFMAGLLNISNDCIEAATIDGANGWQCFWRIKFPLLAPTTVYLLLTSVIFAAERAFTAINLLTEGGPSYATTNLSYVIYEFGFKYYNIGMASAIAVFTSIIFLVITILMMRSMGGFGYDDQK